MICRNCNKSFPIINIISGKKRNAQRRKFCYDCSPFGEHNTRKNVKKWNHNLTLINKRQCSQCFHIFPLNIKYFFRKNTIDFRGECKQCHKNKINKKRAVCKQIFVNKLGGKCIRCGYNKSIAALEFHHLNKKNKEFNLSNVIRNNNIQKIERELKNCELICANCHREIHHGDGRR